MSLESQLISFAKAATAIGGFCVAQTFCTPDATNVILPALGASLGGAYSHQFLNDFFSKGKIFGLLRQKHPKTLNHDLDRVVKTATITALGYIQALANDLVSEKEKANAGFYGNAPAKRINDFFRKNLEEIKVFVKHQVITDVDFLTAEGLISDIGSTLFNDVGKETSEGLWKDIKKLFSEKIPFCYDLAIKETLKDDERGLKAFIIVMLRDLKDQASKNREKIDQVNKQLEMVIEELEALAENQVTSSLILQIQEDIGLQIDQLKLTFNDLKVEIKNLAAGVELMMEYILRTPQPKLEVYVGSSVSNMVFRARSTELYGREKELHFLKRFCEEDGFHWWTLLGEGGSGKSRLALDFCLALAATKLWNAGFLSSTTLKNFDWSAWEPSQNTFIVIDYVSRYADEVTKLIKSLSLVKGSNNYKIKVLLLERYKDATWSSGLDAGVYNGSVKQPFDDELRLERLNDHSLTHIISDVLVDISNMPPAKIILEHVERLDKQKRPLFAILVATEHRAGINGASGSRQQLLDGYLIREHEEFWKQNLPDQQLRERHEWLVALVTILGGLGIKNLLSVLEDAEGLLPAIDQLEIKLIATLELYDQVKEFLMPIEPDIIGEYFVLKAISNVNSLVKLSRKEKVAQLVKLAWKISPSRTVDFIGRAMRDFPKMEWELLMIKAPPEDADDEFLKAWCSLKSTIIESKSKKISSLKVLEEIEKDYFELEKYTAIANKSWYDYRVKSLKAIIKNFTINGYAEQAKIYYERIWKIIDAQIDEYYIIEASYLCSHLVNVAIGKMELSLAEYYFSEFEWLLKIDPTEATRSLRDKAYGELKYFKGIYEHIEASKKLLAASADKEETLKDIDSYLEAYHSMIYLHNRLGEYTKALYYYKKIESEMHLSKNDRAPMQMAYSAKNMLLNARIKNQDDSIFVLKFKELLLEHTQPEILENFLLMWRRVVEISEDLTFLNAKAILEECDIIFDLDYAKKLEWEIYWTIVDDLFEKFFRSYQIEEAIWFFDKLKLMLELERNKTNYVELSNAAIFLSIYFEAKEDLMNMEKFKSIGKQSADLAGVNFKRNFFILKNTDALRREFSTKRRSD